MNIGDRFNPHRMFNSLWIPDWLSERTELDPADKLVFGKLNQFSGENGYCWPFIKTLAQKIGVSEKTVERATQRLEELGLLEVERPEDRKNWSNEELVGLETCGNRYFFIVHEWMLDCVKVEPPKRGPAAPTDKESVDRQTKSRLTDRQRVGCPTDKKSPPSKLRESGEENHGRESDEACEPVASLPAGPPQPDRTLGAAASPPTSNTCAQESEEDPAGAEGCEKLNPPPPGDSVDAVVERVRREKLARLGALVTDVAKGTEEAKAKKLGKRHKPAPWQPPPGEVEELPPELQKDNTRGHLMRVWMSELQSAFPDKSHSNKWGQREYGQLQLLLDRWESDRVEDAFRYVIRNWIKLRERLFKGVGSPTPSVGVVLALHDSLVSEAQVWAKHRDTVEEYEKFGDRYDERPAELLARYLDAQKELKALGL
jgi:hypothetical protein